MYFFFAMTKNFFFKYQQRGEAELLVSRASGTNAASARFPGYGGSPQFGVMERAQRAFPREAPNGGRRC